MKTVLLVDDDPIFHFLNSKIISVSNVSCEVKSVHDGRQAIQLLKDGYSPEFIFLDLDMPHMNGFQFIEAFNNLPAPSKANITIVVLTSSETIEEQNRVSSMGVRHYLSKPLTEAAVKELMT
jgi:CheY-like chemotaxis protein